MRKENNILVIIITLICVNLCGCSYTSSYVAMDAVVESFYEGSQMISKVSLILNGKIHLIIHNGMVYIMIMI